MRLYIVRHADPDYPRDRLSPRGHREAVALGRRFQGEGIDRLYTSPMTRARETAGHLGEACGLEPGVLEWAREIEDWWIDGGPMEEWPAWNVDGNLIRSLPLVGENWTGLPPFDRAVLAEGFARLKSRSDRFLAGQGYVREAHGYRMVEGNRRKLVVVCHGGVALSWLGHLLEIPLPLVWAGLYLAPSSVTVVRFEQRDEERAAPRCLAVGDTSHLLAEGMSPNEKGLVGSPD